MIKISLIVCKTIGKSAITKHDKREYTKKCVGGGSVVVKDIPDNVVAVGNPCRPIRPITEADKHKSWDR